MRPSLSLACACRALPGRRRAPGEQGFPGPRVSHRASWEWVQAETPQSTLGRRGPQSRHHVAEQSWAPGRALCALPSLCFPISRSTPLGSCWIMSSDPRSA